MKYPEFEKYVRNHHMAPVGRFELKTADVLVADSGEWFWGKNKEGIEGRWYRTMFAFERDKMWVGSYEEYPAVDYDLISAAEGQKKRVEESLEYASNYLKQLTDAGLYD